MSDNQILSQIRRVRDEHAKECDYDVHILFERMRADTEKLRADGWRIAPLAGDVSSLPYSLRDKPPTDASSS